MPPKTTQKITGKKPEDAKPASKATSAPKTTAKASPEKDKKGAGGDAPATPKVVKEAISLIDAKPKTKRIRAASELENRIPIPISKILAPETAKPAAPAPVEPPPVVEESAPET